MQREGNRRNGKGREGTERNGIIMDRRGPKDTGKDKKRCGWGRKWKER